MQIMQIAGRMPDMERLVAPDASVRRVASICGSSIEVDINARDGNILEYAHKINACILGQAAASIVARNIVGTPGDEMRRLRMQMERMLKNGGEAPAGRWRELEYLSPVRDFAPRHASTLLVFDAVVACLDMIDARKPKIMGTENPKDAGEEKPGADG